VLTSLRNVFSARRDYSQTRYTYLLNTLKLRQAAGTLSDQDIVAMNTFMTTTPKQLAASLQDSAPAATDLEDNGSFEKYSATPADATDAKVDAETDTKTDAKVEKAAKAEKAPAFQEPKEPTEPAKK